MTKKMITIFEFYRLTFFFLNFVVTKKSGKTNIAGEGLMRTIHVTLGVRYLKNLSIIKFFSACHVLCLLAFYQNQQKRHSEIIMFTHQAVNVYYYKLTVDGINVILFSILLLRSFECGFIVMVVGHEFALPYNN